MKNMIILCAIFPILLSCKFKYEEKSIPKEENQISIFPDQQGLVNDYEDIFTSKQRLELNKILVNFKDGQGKEIIIATVTNTDNYVDFEKYTHELGINWMIGKNTSGKTVLIVISKSRRKLGTSMATGISSELEDKMIKEISEVVIPELKKNNFYEGIENGSLKLISIWQ